MLYELDDEPLAGPKPLTPLEEYKVAKQHFARLPDAQRSLETAAYQIVRSIDDLNWIKDAAFATHQAIERLYSTALLSLTNYAPPSHNLNFLRTMAEGRDRRPAEAWPRDQQRHRAWFNTINEAYVKARYSEHYEISEEALNWLGQQTAILHSLVETICTEHLERLKQAASM